VTITQSVTKEIIRKLLHGEDYRSEIIRLIDAEFLQYVIDFFRKVIDAKLKHQMLSINWYKQEFLKDDLPSDELAIYSGLNRKTIGNMYNSTKREIVLQASIEHYEMLLESIQHLIDQENQIDVTLTIKMHGVSVDLNLNESLIVINSLAVKRAALRGSLWSSAGKRVEKPLMLTLCRLFEVPFRHYDQNRLPPSLREVDFYLLGISEEERYKCEVKLMGKGNPESADVVYARESKVFIADKLSDLNKKQLEQAGIEWVELRADHGYQRFAIVLDHLRIPHAQNHPLLDPEVIDVILQDVCMAL
jgi:hypothetical protein